MKKQQEMLGGGLNIESIKVKSDKLQIRYKTHVSCYGWTNWTYDGKETLSTGAKIEAIQIELVDSDEYIVEYRTYVQNIGWTGWVQNGEISGTIGQSKRVEAIQIRIKEKLKGVNYKTYIQNNGWEGWKANEQTAGTTGQSKKIESIKIELNGYENLQIRYRTHVSCYGWTGWANDGEETLSTGAKIEAIQIELVESDEYIVEYRTHVQNIGWTGWVQNGEISGTIGQSKRVEAIQIRIKEKPKGVNYKTYIQNNGWEGWKANEQTAGTTGQSKKIESIKIKLNGYENLQIRYRTHVSCYGWTDWVYDGKETLSTGAKIEAIQIELVNSEVYTIEYKVHVENIGWMDWTDAGEVAGTTGQSKRIEAIQIRIKQKEKGIQYKTYIQNTGWEKWKINEQTAGTTGKSKKIESIKVELNGYEDIKVRYKAHVSCYGWTNWTYDGEETLSTGAKIEAIQIELVNSKIYTIQYRAYVENIGWMNWVKDGNLAGTTGQSKKIEAIQIRIVPKVYDGIINIDSPTHDQKVQGTSFKLEGWELSECLNPEMKIYIDNNIISSNVLKKERQDVINVYKEKYGDISVNTTPGFETNIDVSNLKDGRHTIKIETINPISNKVITSVSDTFILQKYLGLLKIEYPNQNITAKDEITISGWGMSQTSNIAINMYFDNTIISSSNILRSERADVITEYANTYGDTTINPTPGFSTILNISKYSAGNHVIKVEMKNLDTNEIIQTQKKTILTYKDVELGIDVSYSQGNIDWEKVSKTQIDFVIIRCGYGMNQTDQDDVYFKDNVEGCIKYNIPFGVYLYSYANTEEKAHSEAQHLIRLCEQYKSYITKRNMV